MNRKTVTFATTVWEKDWRQILLDPDYLPVKQIGHHCFAFEERILVINNVDDLPAVRRAAQRWVDEKVLTRIVEADEAILPFFGLQRSDFSNDWVYYNALGPLAAIHAAKSDYLLYLTGDVRLDAPLDWIGPAIGKMEKEPNYKVANPVWNGKYTEAKSESERKKGSFFIAKQGFSDQIFLVRAQEFQQPIYGEMRDDATHFPRGDVFEMRVFSYMKNRGWERIIFRRGSYTHENFEWAPLQKKV